MAKSLEDLISELEAALKKTGKDITVTNNGPFLEPPYEKCKGDGFKVEFVYKGQKNWVVYDNPEVAYEKAKMFCGW